MSIIAATTEHDRSAWGRGVLASYGAVTPTRAADDPSRFFKLNLRDVLLLLMGCIAMYGAQLGAQYGLRSDIRDLKTSFEAAISQQNTMNAYMQKRLDTHDGLIELNRINTENARQEISRLVGVMMGAGIRGVDHAQR